LRGMSKRKCKKMSIRMSDESMQNAGEGAARMADGSKRKIAFGSIE
jgi:hypothetical protein